MIKTAVSGSSGFIGTHLCNLLGRYEKLDRKGNLPDKVDVIFDLAAYGNLAGHKGSAKMIYNANTQRVAKILTELIKRKEKGEDIKYIYMSTSSVSLPYQTFYSASKKATEEMIKIAVRDYGIKATIVRPYTVIGPREHVQHLIPTIMNSCIWGHEMPFVENPVHDFVDVRDVAKALVLISKKAKFNGEVYEVGSGKQMNNKKILNIVEKTLKMKANTKLVNSVRKYDTNKWRANTYRIKKLGWKPEISIEQSINDMVHYFLPL